MKTTINVILICALALLTMQCEVVSDDLLQSPNAPAPESVSSDFLLNNILLSTPTMVGVFEGDGSAVTRMTQMSGITYESAYQAQFFDTDWSIAYATILKDVSALIPRANERRLFSHAGIARVIRAYTLVNLVDKFGPVPLNEALDETNFNPNINTGPEVYEAALVDLDSALIDLGKDEVRLPGTDVIYGESTEPDSAWITLANTIRLKILYQRRLVSDDATDIKNLLNGDIIDTDNGEAFLFGYSTNVANPDSRHPDYAGNYTGTGTGLGSYMSNHYMNTMWNGKSNPDPRMRYYFYRQVSETTDDVNLQQCINNPPPTHYAGSDGSGVNGKDPYCDDWNDVGYWGRDHGNSQGIPPDQLTRTTYGVYPAGGQFDANQAAGVSPGIGLAGAGIRPMWMPFYTEFVRAEVELAINGNDGGAQTALEAGIRGSINYVIDFAEGNNPTGTNLVASLGASGAVPNQAAIDSYVSDVLTEYNSVSGNQEKLNVIAREFYLALWGNGMEAYNLYRRIAPEGTPTTAPAVSAWDLQPHLNSTPGTFYRTFTYPSAFVERNSSVDQKEGNGVQVFWDNNPGGFGDF